ncbi:MAG: hypothetical protein ACI9R3_001092 [Verrucomicrobiales bacterium]|jgi:hypothetical protein
MIKPKTLLSFTLVVGGLLFQQTTSHSQSDVTQPGDPLIASSENSPGSEAGPNAIDNQPTKYLNFDTVGDPDAAIPSGFVVTPSVGKTVLLGITLQSANDAIERDPLRFLLEGSNDEAPTWEDGNWTVIYENDEVTPWDEVFPDDNRFQTQTFIFGNQAPYAHYRWTVLQVQGTGANSMQIAEVELLGKSAPVDVTQPGDPLIASSENSPGSETGPNAIDNQPTKYLNFDTVGDPDAAIPSGFVVSPSVGATNIIGLSLQSANDAIERDPLWIRLEGSNDDAPTWEDGNWEVIYENDEITPWDEVFPDGDRFQTQEFYFFGNSNSYLHYRWTTLQVQGTGANSMQIAEVELLAFSPQADCTKAMFLTKPVATPALNGETAEFFTKVNGPWPVQWHKNGEPIGGAVQTVYTTGPINSANAGDTYSVEIVGCETSEPVNAVLFDPGTQPVSIGVNFLGGGANGAPTEVDPTDIGGGQLQPYWNNAEGAALLEENLKNSLDETTEVSVEWMAGGTWGAGTGANDTNAKLLNGLIEGGADDFTPTTIVFSGVPDAIYSVLIMGVARPLEFPTVDFEQVESEQRIYMTQLNADQHNPNPRLVQVTSTDPDARGEGNFVRFDDVTPVDGNVTINFWNGIDGGGASTIGAIQLVEAASDPLRFTDVEFDPATRNVTVKWNSKEGRTYTMTRSSGLEPDSFEELTDGINSDGDSTTYVDEGVPAGPQYFYQAIQER